MDGLYLTNGYEQLVEGVEIKTLMEDDSMRMSESVLKKGIKLPLHAHPSVKTGYLLKGRIRLYINGHVKELFPGHSWCIQDQLAHWAEIVEDSVVIEVLRHEKHPAEPQRRAESVR